MHAHIYDRVYKILLNIYLCYAYTAEGNVYICMHYIYNVRIKCYGTYGANHDKVKID